MDTVRIVKGTEYGNLNIVHLDPDTAFELWSTHYDTDLKRLYAVFQEACYENSVNWYRYIDFPTFREYLYKNSSKYLSPWL